MRKLPLLFSAALLLMPAAALAADENFNKQMDEYLADEKNMEKLGSSIEQHFLKKRQQEQAASAKADADKTEEQFKNPVAVDIAGAPVRGNPNAKVTIVEYSDFQCPYCGNGAKTMDEVVKEYGDNVRVAFKHFPLPFHPEAKPAARAAIAAQNQGKFWEMHDQLFEKQAELGTETYMQIAKDLGLDMDKFKTDMESPQSAAQVEKDLAQGREMGVEGTPGFFVNGVQLKGAQPLPAFKRVIDRWLKGSPS